MKPRFRWVVDSHAAECAGVGALERFVERVEGKDQVRGKIMQRGPQRFAYQVSLPFVKASGVVSSKSVAREIVGTIVRAALGEEEATR